MATPSADILSANLSVLFNRISRGEEKLLAFLAELGEEHGRVLATREHAAAPILHNLFSKDFFPAPHASHLPENEAPLSHALQTGYEALLPIYTNALLATCRAAKNALTLSDFLSLRKNTAARIAYMKNAYADEAYDLLAPLLPSPTVSYTDSYRAACEEVSAREADFCILPYENAGGYLTATEAMAERYDLCRVGSCRVFHADGTDVTHFALYGRDFLSLDAEAPCTLLYRFPYEEDVVIARHFAALAGFSVKVARFLAEASEDGDHAMQARITATVPKKTLIPFLTYLSAFTQESVICGLYKEKEA